MSETTTAHSKSFFAKDGFRTTIEIEKVRLQRLYKSDDTPWVIGYSGGKDSTAVVQLVWLALSDLDVTERTKPVHVITTDTLVENPIVSSWVTHSLDVMRHSAASAELPFKPELIEPDVTQTFWVNLIGKGYPAPRPRFRWCTERLKIKPSSRFIQEMASDNGEVILLLGARKAESTVRAARFKEREKDEFDGLTPHPDLASTLVLSPIQEWTNDDVWTFLMRIPNPWGHSNKDLMAMYRGATEDNECPVVVDTSTPSCGNSRFGCWVCTLVDQDKSMAAMIHNDADKEWMLPMLALRDELDFRGPEAYERDRARRDFRRITGDLTVYTNRDGDQALVHGPYTAEARKDLLTRLLSVQQNIRSNPATPAHLRDLSLISISELQEIRRIWVVEKGEIEDLLPDIFETIVGNSYPGPAIDESLVFDRSTFKILEEICGNDSLLYETTRNLLNVQRQYALMGKRHGLFELIEETLKKGYFVDEEDALSWAMQKKKIHDPSVLHDAPLGNEIEAASSLTSGVME